MPLLYTGLALFPFQAADFVDIAGLPSVLASVFCRALPPYTYNLALGAAGSLLDNSYQGSEKIEDLTLADGSPFLAMPFLLLRTSPPLTPPPAPRSASAPALPPPALTPAAPAAPQLISPRC